MDGPGLLVLVALVGFGLSVGSVIGWFKYRRFGSEVDYRVLGIGFLIAGLVALFVLLPTDGPWIIGVAFMVVGGVYLTRSRRIPGGGTARPSPADRTESQDTTASAEAAGPFRPHASRSRIEVGDRVLLITDVRLPRRDRDWQHETLPQGTEGVVLALIHDEDQDDQATGMTDMGARVSVPAGVLVQAADHEYGIRDFRFAAGQVIVKRRAR